ncbi:DUF3800 domain-containing protein [Neorhizobium sp. BETTINA12A]|uniref:DUF3800 domain-containing protein n=1 Tax=Neorhizobium sp. BETTINA12A TaxID=2908924 RepID=UPI001FF5DC75|nr:DUF3800 domain-containing protein [Neorhizobium sp. BETTINA12A]MCJ9749478.1 DUF3800 domain-containing protein [Neorhizobium sp. BETTINA12A]
MAKRHYTIFCDESAKKGRYFSNFYGGALLKSEDRQAIEAHLRAKQAELNISGEMKWTKITKNYQEKYIEYIRLYFDFVRTGRIKLRIMFTHNYRRAKNLTDDHHENQYFILYYQMLKHAFGLQYSNPNFIDRIYVSTLLDEIPDTKEKLEKFRNFIAGIENTVQYRGKGIYFLKDQIGDVNSHDHAILQGLDIILGSIYFRLNDLHKEKPEGQRIRAKRTIAKENVYNEINRQIRSIYPNFNIGVTTGAADGESVRWTHPYRHWCFRPSDYEIDEKAVKPR